MEETVAGASAAPNADTGTGSPAPSETAPGPETSSSRFASLMSEGGEDAGEDPAEEANTGVEGEETAEVAEAAAETEDGKPADPEAPKEEPELEEEDVPKDLKAVLKKHPELRAAHFYKRDMDELGLSVEEAKAYRSEIQSIDDLRYVLDQGKALDAFEGLLRHPDENAPGMFLDAIKGVDGSASSRLVKHVAKNLRSIDPDAYLELAGGVVEQALARFEALAGEDGFRREAVAEVRQMIEELEKTPPTRSTPKPAPLASPDAEELERRRAAERQSATEAKQRLVSAANKAADDAVRTLLEDIRKRRDPDGLLVTDDDVKQIVTKVHETVARGPALNRLFVATLDDTTLPADERVKKASALVKARAQAVADLVWKEQTKGIAERVKRASQAKLQKAAKVVSIREATGGRAAGMPQRPLPRGARPTSRELYRSLMRSS